MMTRLGNPWWLNAFQRTPHSGEFSSTECLPTKSSAGSCEPSANGSSSRNVQVPSWVYFRPVFLLKLRGSPFGELVG